MRLHSVRRCTLVLLFAVALLAPALVRTPVASARLAAPGAAPAPTFTHGDLDYVYDQLATMATRFQHREAGYTSEQNGHDAFAAYWTDEIRRTLGGFGPTVRTMPVALRGWRNRPAQRPGTNVEVTIPGREHPERIVVVGCHYDGEATSTQSAYDDASGCAIELGVARLLAVYWRAHGLAPASTLRFVLFDAEEQGLIGSFAYVNGPANAEMGRIVAMLNEEQNGIQYPLRYLGRAGNPVLPYNVLLSPGQPNATYPDLPTLPIERVAQLTHLTSVLRAAVPATFAQFHAAGITSLAYHSDSDANTPLPVFTDDDLREIHIADDDLGSSDQVPFTVVGVPNVTLVGESSYYEKSPAPWAYPYDRPDDTIELMNVFAGGTVEKQEALVLALGLPTVISVNALLDADLAGGAAPATSDAIAATITGVAKPGQELAFDAATTAPAGTAITWDFGDGGRASGQHATHAYAGAGTYTVTATATRDGGTATTRLPLVVSASPAQIANPPYDPTGAPPENPAVKLPPLAHAGASTTSTHVGVSSKVNTSLPPYLVIAGSAFLLALLVLAVAGLRRGNATRTGAESRPVSTSDASNSDPTA